MAKRFTYAFSDYEETTAAIGKDNLKAVLGAKGANLAELTFAGANVPKGFTITTELCREFYKQDPPAFPEGFLDELKQTAEKLEEETERKLECGEGEKPLILSARYGAEVPLQKTCLTFFNIGFNDAAVAALAASSESFASWYWGQYVRYIETYASVILKVDPEVFKEAISAAKSEKGVDNELDLEPEDLEKLVNAMKEVLENQGKPFPQDTFEQLKAAIEAVLLSWGSPEAREFRETNGISQDAATAVNVMVQVFGTMGDASGSGVYFTRNPSNGDGTSMMGSWSPSATGTEFLAKTKPPQPIATLESVIPSAIDKIHEANQKLEKHFKDIQKVDFTIENGELYILQSRTSRRTPVAGLKLHVDFVNEGVMTKEECVQRTTLEEVEAFLNPCFKGEDLRAHMDKKVGPGKGTRAGVVVGRVCFSAEKVRECAQEETPVPAILIAEDITPQQYSEYMNLSGLVTPAPLDSRAANFARQRKFIAITSCEMEINSEEKFVTIGGKVVKEGDMISIDGGSGDIFLAEVPISQVEFEEATDLQQILTWADEVRKAENNMQLYANADTEEDFKRARTLGAEGIGLCRSETLLIGERLEALQKFIFTDKEDKKKEAMQAFEEQMAAEYCTLLESVPGFPTVIRLVDPPIQNFLPDLYQLVEEVSVMETKKELGIPLEPEPPEEEKPAEGEGEKPADSEQKPAGEESAEGEKKEEEEEKKEEEEEKKEEVIDPLTAKTQMLEKVQAIYSVNPALGARGVRSALCIPGLLRAQLKAIIEGTSLAAEKGAQPMVEVLIPFASSEEEVQQVVQELEAAVTELSERRENQTEIKLGAMIQVPRAAYVAGKIAKHVDIISFGADSLTESISGFSREEAEVQMIPHYIEHGVYAESPFETLDVDGTGRIIEIGLGAVKSANPDASISVCGDQCGDPKSIEFLSKHGFSYISFPPAKLPYARLAAAKTALAQRKEDEPEEQHQPEPEPEQKEEPAPAEEEEPHETEDDE